MGRRTAFDQPTGFGRPTLRRTLEPTMFEALAWETRPAISSGLFAASETAPPPPENLLPMPVEDKLPVEEAEEMVQREPKKVDAKKTRDTLKKPFFDPNKKPTFHAYGRENCEPVKGGVVYGQYLISHNVQAQAPKKYRQVFPTALKRLGRSVPPERPLVPPFKRKKRPPKPPPPPTVDDATLQPASQPENLPPPPPPAPPPRPPPPKDDGVRPAGCRTLRSSNVAECLAQGG